MTAGRISDHEIDVAFLRLGSRMAAAVDERQLVVFSVYHRKFTMCPPVLNSSSITLTLFLPS